MPHAHTSQSTSATALDDCQAAISKIEAHGGNSTFMLREGICLNWIQGSCGVRFCAMPYVQKPLNRTAEWLATYATSPLLDCVKGGQWGLMGDHANINSNAGTYRLHLEYHT
ncbi:hypothetical protein F4780DRAFT_725361 [Xylariomycetidae sp. FL0641]|nr:hypothetical protein F4780DRAFT_725361 [Xylariomycetidae sp. FL0641]